MDVHCARAERLNAIAWVCCFVGLAMAAAGRASADELPRYQLKVGQQLVYKMTAAPQESVGRDGAKHINSHTCDWNVYVVGASDAGWRLVFRETLRISQAHQINGQNSKHVQVVHLDGHFDLSSQGRIVEDVGFLPFDNPSVLFPPLPSTAEDGQRGWNTTLDIDHTQRKFHMIEPDKSSPGESRFVESPQTALDGNYDLSTRREYVFDCAQGVMRKATTTSKYGWSGTHKPIESDETVELIEVRQLDTPDLDALRQETDRYYAAANEYDELMSKVRQDVARAAQWHEQAEKHLKTVESQITIPWLRDIVAAKVKQHQDEADRHLKDAAVYAALLDKPSEDWQTTDLDGKPHALADYRGKVVVLDFWYRSCAWCIRAMPQINQLNEDFAAQDVVILGINSDRDEIDARFVIEHMKLNYLTLKNGQTDRINAKYKVHFYPTLVFIDKNGKVRNFHFGATANMRQEVGDKIRELLAEK